MNKQQSVRSFFILHFNCKVHGVVKNVYIRAGIRAVII